jgi:hypothetical protein
MVCAPHAIMGATGKSKTSVWCWLERFADEGVECHLRDKTQPSRILTVILVTRVPDGSIDLPHVVGHMAAIQVFMLLGYPNPRKTFQ